MHSKYIYTEFTPVYIKNDNSIKNNLVHTTTNDNDTEERYHLNHFF